MNLPGLLSGEWTADQDQNKAIQQGLLSAAFSLMGARGRNLGGAIGQAGMQGMQSMQQVMQQARENKLRDLQTQEMQQRLATQQTAAERQKRVQALQQQFVKPGAKPDYMDDRDVGQPGEAPIPARSFDYNGYAQALAGEDPMGALQLQSALQKDDTPIALPDGGMLVTRTGRKLAENSKQAAPTELARLFAEMQALPSNHPARAMYADAIRKATTHTPGTTVSFGQPVAGVDPQGNPVFFQPSRDGSTPPAIVPGVKPAPQNRDMKLPAELQRMQIAGDAMVSLLDDYETALKGFDPRSTDQLNTTKRADIQSLKRNIELQLKELQALGALAGPDVGIIRESLADPTGVAGAVYGREGIGAQIQRARDLVRVRNAAVLKSQTPPGQQASASAAQPRSASGQAKFLGFE